MDKEPGSRRYDEPAFFKKASKSGHGDTYGRKTTSGVGILARAAQNKATTGETSRSRDDVLRIKRPRVWRTPVAANISFAANER